MNARDIDRHLTLGWSAHMISRRFGIPLSTVQFREVLRKEREKARYARRKARELNPPSGPPKIDEQKLEEERMAKWCALPIVYADDPRSRPFDYPSAIRNTMRLKPQRQSGGGVSDIYSHRGMDFHAATGRKAA